MFLLVVAALGIAVGVVVRRWWVLALAVAFPFYVAGVRAGWWGHGTGDLWELATLIVTLVSVLALAAGVVIGRALTRLVTRSSSA